ncbi:MAG: hypothetical protein NMNS01_01020 [Nitrosomonas sp.]|nr:MAG: hypothetical protein NMNS01_01020 [Nitrosomonas sp.]
MINNIFFLLLLCVALSTVSIYMAIKWANTYRIADHPGEHKQHDESTPFVGGVGLFAAVCVAFAMLISVYPEHIQKWLVLGLCSVIIFITGFTDDIVRLSYKSRLIIQSVVALIMALVGGIVLNDLGGLLFGLTLQLHLLAIPFTVFAIVGGINVINMIDGIDGLSGSLSLISLLLLGIVALVAGDMPNLLLITTLIGGISGFLFFNLRFPSQSSARVFLGDNGSMLIGLLLAWLLVDLSQGSSPAMRPVVAIWLLAIPLMDAVSVMHRRIRMGLSPFKPDRNHLHHILLRAGYRVEEVVFAIVFLHFLLGIIGLTGLYLNVPDTVMLFGFLLIYAGYLYLTLHPWHYIPALCILHTRLHLTPAASRGTFAERHTDIVAKKLARRVSKEIRSSRSRVDFWVQIFEQLSESSSSEKRYALALNVRLSRDYSYFKIKRYIALLQQRLNNKYGIRLRQLVARKSDIDWKVIDHDDDTDRLPVEDKRKAFQRTPGSKVLVFEVSWDVVNLKEPDETERKKESNLPETIAH